MLLSATMTVSLAWHTLFFYAFDSMLQQYRKRYRAYSRFLGALYPFDRPLLYFFKRSMNRIPVLGKLIQLLSSNFGQSSGLPIKVLSSNVGAIYQLSRAYRLAGVNSSEHHIKGTNLERPYESILTPDALHSSFFPSPVHPQLRTLLSQSTWNPFRPLY